MTWRKQGLHPPKTFTLESGHNRLIQNVQAGSPTRSIVYDDAGGRLTEVDSAVYYLDRQYFYDALGRRIVKRVYSSASGGTEGYTRFVYKGSHVSFETDSAGTIGLSYTWGAGTDDLVAITTAAGAHYYVTTDKLGSVRSIAKRDGTWQLSQRFDPYGRLIVRDTAGTYTLGAQLRYGWTGREWDAETGFSYHRARYFDPESRRWTQEDPIGVRGGHERVCLRGWESDGGDGSERAEQVA